MAEKLNNKRKSETVRERSQKPEAPVKKRRVHQTVKTLTKPVHAARRIGKKEYYLPLPDNKPGRFMNKKRSFMPSYFKKAWGELKFVTWPSRRETWQLTFAVFVFAFIFGVMVTVTDYGLDKIFKRILLK